MHMRVLLFRVFFVIPLYIILNIHFFLVMGGGEKILCSLTPFACLSNYRLPIPYCALRSQHLLSQMHSLSIIPELYSGTFPQKSTFIKISLPLHLPKPPRVKDQGRTKDEPRNTQRTPNHPKVLFIKIGYLKEIFVTVASAICLPCQMPLSISFTPLCKVSLHSRTSAKMSHR